MTNQTVGNACLLVANYLLVFIAIVSIDECNYCSIICNKLFSWQWKLLKWSFGVSLMLLFALVDTLTTLQTYVFVYTIGKRMFISHDEESGAQKGDFWELN